MKREDISHAINSIQDGYIQEAGESTGPKKMKRSWIKWSAIAACLCAAFLATFFSMPSPANVFAVKAFALETMDDGTIGLSAVDLLDQPDVWGGHFDGENFYVSLGLRYEGENIAGVEFTTEEGFFAKQYISDLTAEDDVTRLYVGAENRLVMYGTDFETVGASVRLNDETLTDDLLLFWGIKAADMSDLPEGIEIVATATFYDGQTQKITVPIDISGTGAFIGIISDKERLQHARRRDYYMSLPLEQCELVEESVETVTDAYEVKLESSTSWVELRDDMEFDADGFFRCGTTGDPTANGYEIYIPVIKRNTDGTFTGMLYRVPEHLHYTPGPTS